MKKFFEENCLTILLFFLIAIFYIFAVNTSGDTYYFMVKGREIWETKSIPQEATRVYGLHDKSLILVEWVAGLIYYFAVSLFGMNGLVFVRVILAVSTIYFVYKSINIFTKNQIVLNATTLVTSYILATRTNDRPETFSYLFVSILGYVCLKYIYEKSLSLVAFSLPFIFLLWPNTHPFSIMGVVLFTFYMLLILKERLLGGKSQKKFQIISVIYAASLALSLVQYERLFAFLHAGNLATRFTEFYSLKGRIMLSGGYDFLNQTPIEVYFYIVYFLLYIFTAVLFFSKNRSRILDVLPRQILYLAIILLPIKFYRTIPLMLIITVPGFMFLLSNTSQSLKPKTKYALTFLVLSVFLILITASIPNKGIIGFRENTFVFTETDASGNQKTIGAINRWWLPKFPIGAENLIKNYTTGKRIFTDTGWNNYFLWHLPAFETFADAQSYNRTQKDWDEERNIFYGTGKWQELLKSLDVDVVVNSQPNAIAYVYAPVHTLQSWRLLFVNEIYTIYVREDKIREVPTDLSKINPQLPFILKYKQEDEKEAVEQLKKLLEFDKYNGYARDQLINYYILTEKDLQKAKMLSEESRKLKSNDPVYTIHLANIYALEGNCTIANEFKKETFAKSFKNPIINGMAELATQRCN